MGSVLRRIKRNVTANDMAVASKVKPPVVVYRDSDGHEARRVFLSFVPMIVYRATMLRIKARHKRHTKDVHHEQQEIAAIEEKRTRKPRNEGSMVRRFFKGLFKGRSKR